MKFAYYLKTIQHVEIYPLISLLLFFGVFVLATIYVFSTDKQKMDDYANIPLK